MSAIRAYRTCIQSAPGMQVCILLDLGATEFRHYMSEDAAKTFANQLVEAILSPPKHVGLPSEVAA